MTRIRASLLSGAACFMVAAAAQAGTIYTNNPNLADLTSGINNFATFLTAFSSDQAVPFTPSATTLAQGLRVVGDDGRPAIVVRFPAAVSDIRVFPNIDHLGWGPDGYQYSIAGSNDGSTYTPLFDALTVTGTAEPFTLGLFTGTAPSRVNNILSPGAGPGGQVGYVADFSFGQPYKYYSFGASTAARGDNQDEELSAVGSPDSSHMPEPATYFMVLIGAGLIGFRFARSRK